MSRAVLSQPEAAVAARVIAAVAPAEGPLLEQLIRPGRLEFLRRSGAVGYGIEDIVQVASPYVLVGVGWAWAVVANEAKVQAEEKLKRLTSRAFGRKAEPPKALDGQPPKVTEADLRSLVLDRLIELGCTADEAVRLSRAISREVVDEYSLSRALKNPEQ